MSAFKRVLVANRGEIAIRIFRTLRELGIESIAVYSDADRNSLHLEYADRAVALGGEAPADSYLRGELILEHAKKLEVDAIHPGYGFLAENADFARACASTGIIFIGPSADAIDAMGSKTASRDLMQRAGVPIVPGSTEPVATLDAARAEAEEIGYPIAVKARSGGGGKGFRVALTADDLASAFEGASGEGARYFSDDAVYLERYLPDPRHVEVQLLADTHGSVIHLGERDCSVQRRHQKLIEECPGPHVGKEFALDLREKLGKIAVDAARAVNYTSAGTIECLLGPDNTPYFLEMNTRVQVEHTVTEMVTGVDIVAEQIRIAQGEPLPFTQDDVEFRGHAIECRINAEDAIDDFRPSSGPIQSWATPDGIGVRLDAGYRAGSVVSPFYDTLLAKLVVWAPDRPRAISRMRRALAEFHVEGVHTLVDFHRAIFDDGEFAAGGTCRESVTDTHGLLARTGNLGKRAALDEDSIEHGVARPAPPQPAVVEVDGERREVLTTDASRLLPPTVRPRTSGSGAAGEVVAPIPGNVLQVRVEQGQRIQTGEVVCILEAMKMENEIAAGATGLVAAVQVSAGDAVSSGQLLVTITPDE